MIWMDIRGYGYVRTTITKSSNASRLLELAYLDGLIKD